jgi:Ca2+/Na+ antiporter
MMTLMSATISLSLGSTLMIMIFNRFHSSKIHGIYLILLYIVFTVLAILFELSII